MGMYADMSMCMCTDMCMGMRAEMCMDMCTDPVNRPTSTQMAVDSSL